jgi:putative membrane protein
METAQKADLRDSLAAERTFLAWIRTGLALTGFGFVVARFGPYLHEFQLGAPSGDISHGMSLLLGTALIDVGVVVYLLSAWHHFKLVQELERGAPPPSRPSIQAIVIALFLALVGVGMAIYLLSIRHSANMHVGSNQEVPMAPAANGIISKPSSHSVDQTVAKLKNILKSKAVTLFALVDHSGEAEKVGLQMPPTKLLIFGSPKAGTPLMLA